MTPPPPPQGSYPPPYGGQQPYGQQPYGQQPPAQWVPPVQPSGPAPGIRFASSGARLVAFFVDGFILGLIVSIFYVIGFVVLAAGVTVNGRGSATLGAGFGIGMIVMLIGVVVGLLWKPWFWSHGGQTPGYKMLGMRLVRSVDGGPVGFGTAILRIFGYLVSGVLFDLGFIWIIFDSQHQGWHDKIAGTVVIQS